MDAIEAFLLNPNIRKECCSVCNLLLLKDETNVLAFSYAGQNKWYHRPCAENTGKAIAFTLTAYLYPATVVYEYSAAKGE